MIGKSIFATLERLKSIDVAQRPHENKISYERWKIESVPETCVAMGDQSKDVLFTIV